MASDSADRVKFRHTCGKKISCPSRVAGKFVRCPRCGQAAAVPTEVRDHTIDDPPARLSDKQPCQLRRGGQGVVVKTTVGKIKADAAAGALAGEDLIRLGDTGEWLPIKDHAELAAHLGEQPSRVGGISFDLHEPETQEDALGEADAARAMCEHHPDRPAEFLCSQCRKALCPECCNRLDGEPYCEQCTDNLLAELRKQAAVAKGEQPPTSPDETPAETIQSVAAKALASTAQTDPLSDTGLAEQAVVTVNKAVYLELALAYVLSWPGIGWLHAGQSKVGFTLLVSNFALVICELLALLAFRSALPGLAGGLWLVIPGLLLQNILIGTCSAVMLRRACVEGHIAGT